MGQTFLKIGQNIFGRTKGNFNSRQIGQTVQQIGQTVLKIGQNIALISLSILVGNLSNIADGCTILSELVLK